MLNLLSSQSAQPLLIRAHELNGVGLRAPKWFSFEHVSAFNLEG